VCYFGHMCQRFASPVIISYHLFSFHKSIQDYIIHMDMEIIIFVGIKGLHQHKCIIRTHILQAQNFSYKH